MTNLKALLPYVRYLPVILAAVQAAADTVEAISEGNTSAEKQEAGVQGARKILLAAGLDVPVEVLRFLVDGVVAVSNALRRYSKKN